MPKSTNDEVIDISRSSRTHGMLCWFVETLRAVRQQTLRPNISSFSNYLACFFGAFRRALPTKRWRNVRNLKNQEIANVIATGIRTEFGLCHQMRCHGLMLCRRIIAWPVVETRRFTSVDRVYSPQRAGSSRSGIVFRRCPNR